ncbi:MAG: hypothetical protein HY711_09330 [Candidatus Melainabacteria bacterium]|nr:hypothetical protein [Candidatus Melainabacteria bacterium]
MHDQKKDIEKTIKRIADTLTKISVLNGCQPSSQPKHCVPEDWKGLIHQDLSSRRSQMVRTAKFVGIFPFVLSLVYFVEAGIACKIVGVTSLFIVLLCLLGVVVCGIASLAVLSLETEDLDFCIEPQYASWVYATAKPCQMKMVIEPRTMAFDMLDTRYYTATFLQEGGVARIYKIHSFGGDATASKDVLTSKYSDQLLGENLDAQVYYDPDDGQPVVAVARNCRFWIGDAWTEENARLYPA